MTALTYTIDARALTGALSRFVDRQVPFALAQTLTGAALATQADAQAQIRTRFTVAPSKQQWMARLVKLPREDRARKDKLWAEVGIYEERGNHVLTRHIEGGPRTSEDEVHPFFIPSDYLRPTATSLPARRLYPRALRLMDRRTPEGVLRANVRRGKSGQLVGQGKRATWLVPIGNAKGRTPGIYQRLSADRDDVQLLWLYRRRITLPRRLDWTGAVERAGAAMPEAFVAHLYRAVRTAR